jgi:predicted transcriptional regulator
LEFLFCSQSVIGNVDRQLVAASGPALSVSAYCFILKRIGFDFFGLVNEMADDGRVVTAKLPDDLVSRMDEIADRIESWIVRQAVTEWLAEEQRRYELTLEALKSVDEGRTLTQEEVEKHFAKRRKARARTTRAA